MRRNGLPARFALTAITDAAQDTPDDDGPPEPKRFEKIVGYEAAEAVASYQLAILPLGNREFPARTIRWGPIPSSPAGDPNFLQESAAIDWPAYPGYVSEVPGSCSADRNLGSSVSCKAENREIG
ncbi:MAG: hypothetical protein WAN33_16575 [Candidatus Acidiferrales bacterium]